MKPLCVLLVLFAFLQWGCDQPDAQVQPEAEQADAHAQAIAKFQDAQQRFKELIATIRDQESYDKASKGLAQVVTDFRSATSALQELDPPDEASQAKFNKMIVAGISRTEPTGEDMISLISIETREEQISEWMEEFVAAGQEAGSEFRRLYGPIDYPESSNPGLEIDSNGNEEHR